MSDENNHNLHFSINLRLILIAVIFVFAFFTRFYNLQEKPLMHDESLFTFYSWFLATNGDYDYQPILHGPLLEDATAFIYLTLGDSTYTMRLFPAIVGFCMLFVLLKFKRRLGREGLVAALALFALSPTLMYYSRFFRNDVPFAFFSLLTIYYYWKFFREGGGRTLCYAVISSMLLICIKENQLIYFFTIFTFAVLVFIVDVLKDWLKREQPDKKKRKSSGKRHAGKSFLPDAISIVCLLGGIASYIVGFSSKYYAFKLLGFVGIIIYFAMTFRRYFVYVKGEEITSAQGVGRFLSIALFTNAAALTFLGWILYEDLFSGLGKFPYGKISIPLFAMWYLLLFIIREGIEREYGEDKLLRRFFLFLGENYWYLVIGILASCAIYIVLFTTWFKHPEPALNFYKKTFQYWAGQHKEQRIRGAFHYYVPILAIYELPALLFVIGGALVALWKNKTIRRFVIPAYIFVLLMAIVHFARNPISPGGWLKIDKSLHMTSTVHFYIFATVGFFGMLLTLLYLWKKERLVALLVYWAMGSFLGYSFAGEKVPWVTVHIVLPLLLLAAIYVQKLWNSKFFKRSAVFWYILFSIFALWNLKSSTILCFVNDFNIAERMIYGHTTTDLRDCAKEAKHIAFLLGTKEKTRILVKGEAIWPLRWYFRKYAWTEWEKPEATKFPIVFMDYDKAMKVKNLTENYHITKYTVRQWWQPKMLDFKRLFDIRKVLIPKQYVDGKKYGGDIYNSKQEWKKMWKYLIYRKTYEAHDARWPSVSGVDFAFCVRKNLLER